MAPDNSTARCTQPTSSNSTSLPFTYEPLKPTESDASDQCIICLEDLSDAFAGIRCRHRFYSTYTEKYVRTATRNGHRRRFNNLNGKWPLCRTGLKLSMLKHWTNYSNKYSTAISARSAQDQQNRGKRHSENMKLNAPRERHKPSNNTPDPLLPTVTLD